MALHDKKLVLKGTLTSDTANITCRPVGAASLAPPAAPLRALCTGGAFLVTPEAPKRQCKLDAPNLC